MSEKTRSQWFDEYILSIPRPRDATHDGFVEYLIEKLNSQLTLPAPDKGDSPAPEKSTTPEGDTAAGNEPMPAPCG